MKTRIHVNKHVIARNRKTGENEPPLTVKDYKRNRRAHEVEVHGTTRIVHSPDKPLPCGARVWIETDDPVEIVR